mgnify:CR=1 FL=1
MKHRVFFFYTDDTCMHMFVGLRSWYIICTYTTSSHHQRSQISSLKDRIVIGQLRNRLKCLPTREIDFQGGKNQSRVLTFREITTQKKNWPRVCLPRHVSSIGCVVPWAHVLLNKKNFYSPLFNLSRGNEFKILCTHI